MKKIDARYQSQLDSLTAHLMKEFLSWNEVQAELKIKGYENGHYGKTELARERQVFRAIADRLLMEDIPCESWKWFETPWAGTDGNTGMEARVVDFLVEGNCAPSIDAPTGGIVGFYVASNRRFWYAIPLAELPSEGGPLDIFEVNCVQDALNARQLHSTES